MNELLFGAAYYAEYLPTDRTDTDFAMMKKAGMNVIRIAESTWSTWEPNEGEFDFSYLHQMLDAAVRHGLYVIIGTPTYAIPPWMAKKHPDVIAVTKHGPGRYGHRQNMDITHPDYLRYAERIIRKLMEEVKDCPNVIGVQLDNETKSYDTSGERVQKMFVEHLKKTFGTTDAMNAQFGFSYWSNRVNDWNDFPDVRGTINGSLEAEFRKFQRQLVTDFLSWQSSIVCEYLRPDQFITQNFDFGWRGHSFGIQPDVNHFDAAKCLTIAGVDIYHPSQSRLTGTEIAFCGAVARSMKPDVSNYLILETEAQGLHPWLPYPGQLRQQAYSHLASGADSVMYWHWHSIHNACESYWKGVLSHNLKENETYREASVFGNEMKPLEQHLIHLKKKCSAAILVSNESLTGMDIFAPTHELRYNETVRWMYDALYQLNVECDVIPYTAENLSDYKLLLVPALYSADDATLLRLKQYVADGGYLVSSFKTGFSDEYLRIREADQPGLLTECFGVTYDQFTYPENVALTWTEDANLSIHHGAKVSDWMEMLHPTTAEVLAHYEHPFWNRYAAVTKNHYKNGTAVYLGCYFAADALKDLFEQLTVEAGIALPSFQFPLIRKSGTNTLGKQVHYLFNYSGEEVSYTHTGETCTVLLAPDKTTKTVADGDTLNLPPWEVVILEQ